MGAIVSISGLGIVSNCPLDYHLPLGQIHGLTLHQCNLMDHISQVKIMRSVEWIFANIARKK